MTLRGAKTAAFVNVVVSCRQWQAVHELHPRIACRSHQLRVDLEGEEQIDALTPRSTRPTPTAQILETQHAKSPRRK